MALGQPAPPKRRLRQDASLLEALSTTDRLSELLPLLHQQALLQIVLPERLSPLAQLVAALDVVDEQVQAPLLDPNASATVGLAAGHPNSYALVSTSSRGTATPASFYVAVICS